MKKDKLLKKIERECPICGKRHELENRSRAASIVIKGERIDYDEEYLFCENADEDEAMFATAEMESRNLLNARDAYRVMHGLLTAGDIVGIREQYGLSQVELARLLGWGEATIARYESKAIQDDAYDNMLRIIRDNPLVLFDFLQKNGEKLTEKKKRELRERITHSLDAYGREYIKRQALESEYVTFQEASDANGFKTLDITKLEVMISFLAKRVLDLYKVKLMKLLWYADALYFKEEGISMTGLVYCHDLMGALPLGHSKIVELENVKKEEEDDYEFTKFHFLYNEAMDEGTLSEKETKTLERVIDKFKDFSAREIVDYMHQETAYKKTSRKDIIPFSLAREIKAF